ncbi:MAG: DUF2807 domain-containing protein [Gemmatimonadales bacterium]
MITTTRMALAVALPAILAGCLDPTDPSDPDDGEGRIVGSGTIVTVSRPVAGYHAIRLSGVGRLIVTQTGEESFTITADDNIVPLISSSVANGWLVVADPPNTQLEPSQVIVYRITVKNLDAVSISGVVNASVDGILTASFTADINGVTTLTATGSATQQRVSLDGVSTYLAEGLASESVVVTGSGVMTAVVQVSNLLDGDVCGAGSIIYVGMPTVLLRACPGIVVGPKVGGLAVGR